MILCSLSVNRGIWQWGIQPAAGFGPWDGYALCLCTAMVLAPDNGKTFIYFTF